MTSRLVETVPDLPLMLLAAVLAVAGFVFAVEPIWWIIDSWSLTPGSMLTVFVSIYVETDVVGPVRSTVAWMSLSLAYLVVGWTSLSWWSR